MQLRRWLESRSRPSWCCSLRSGGERGSRSSVVTRHFLGILEFARHIEVINGCRREDVAAMAKIGAWAMSCVVHHEEEERRTVFLFLLCGSGRRAIWVSSELSKVGTELSQWLSGCSSEGVRNNPFGDDNGWADSACPRKGEGSERNYELCLS